MDRLEWPEPDDSPSPLAHAPEAPADAHAAHDADDAPAVSPGPEAPSRIRRRLVRIVGAPPEPGVTRPPAEVALRALPIAGVSRRRMTWVLGVVISLWIVAVFARQVGEASAASARADQVRADNAVLAATVTALQHERDVVQERSFVEFQARAFGLGNARDQPFTLAPDAPPLPANAPGSAALQLVPTPAPQTPLDSWLALLFGPAREGR
jgi:hypothetical protein